MSFDLRIFLTRALMAVALLLGAGVVSCPAEIMKGEITDSDYSKAPMDGGVVTTVLGNDGKTYSFETGGYRVYRGQKSDCDRKDCSSMAPGRYISFRIIRDAEGKVLGYDCQVTAVKESEFKKIKIGQPYPEVDRAIGAYDYQTVFGYKKNFTLGYCVQAGPDAEITKYLISYVDEKVTDIRPDPETKKS